jgi:hypothetical protein
MVVIGDHLHAAGGVHDARENGIDLVVQRSE